MRLARIILGVRVPDVSQFRALLSSRCADPESFCLLFRECHNQLTPQESINALGLFKEFFDNPRLASLVPICHTEIQDTLVSDIRGKLYVLTDPRELCEVISGLSKHGALRRELVSDFKGRLERLLPSVRGRNLSHVCNCILYLHEGGHRVTPLCSKLFAHLAAHSRSINYTVENYLALLRCMNKLLLRHEVLEKTIGNGLIKTIASKERISEENIVALLQSYKEGMHASGFIRHRLISMALKTHDVSLELIAHCLSAGVFPYKDIELINRTITEGAKLGSTSAIIDMLVGYGDLRYNPKEVISTLLSAFKDRVSTVCHINELCKLLYGLYRLNVKDDKVTRHATDLLMKKDHSSHITAKDILKMLYYLCHFSFDDSTVYEKLLMELMRLSCSLKDGDLRNTQVIAMYLRHNTGNLPQAFPMPVNIFLSELLSKETSEPITLRTSDVQDEVCKTATFISYSLYKEVQVGPFLADFVRPLTDDEIGDMRQRNNRYHRFRHFSKERELASQLRQRAILVLADDRSQFYRNTKERSAESQFRLGLLEAMGYDCAVIPYWDWERCRDWNEKRSYLQNMLANHSASTTGVSSLKLLQDETL